MHKPLLNAPAGDFDCVKSAINNGADAIFLGIKLFNARRLAHNFSFEDLAKIIRMAKLHNIKVYLTVNTLVRNNELDLWFKTIKQAYHLGIDAVIIQEVWLASLLKKYFPDLHVHASTQASFMNAEGINQFPDFDFVVLARELEKEEIRFIKQHTSVPLEVFVHGHLCISYSGQCLISSFIGKRSGNRGVCASSCRKKYNGDYLISPKDLMLANKVKDLAEVGVDAIKIEGRMKSAEYVGITTKTYRKQLDSLDNFQQLTQKETDNLRMGFNRDFTPGFFSEESTIIGQHMPSNRGILLGVIENDALILKHDLAIHDGIGIWNKGKGKLEGFVLHKMLKEEDEIEHAKKGDTITIPSRFFKEGRSVYLTSQNSGEDLKGKPKLKTISVEVTGELNKSLTFTSGDHVVETTVILQEAKNQDLTQEKIEKELKKSEEWGIHWNISSFSLPKGLFLPISTLKDARLELEQHITDDLVPNRTSFFSEYEGVKDTEFKHESRILAQVHSIKGIEEANTQGAYAVYYDVFKEDVQQAKKVCTKSKLFLDLPVVMSDQDIPVIQKIIDKVQPDGIVIGNWGQLSLDFKGEKHGKYSLNVFNDVAVLELRKKNIIPLASVELNIKNVMDFENRELIYFAHGRPTVMHFKGEYSPKTLTDEKGYRFPLRVVNGTTEMLYSRPVASFEAVKELQGAGIRYFLLDLEKDVKTTIQAYQNILQGVEQDISYLKKGTTIGNVAKTVA